MGRAQRRLTSMTEDKHYRFDGLLYLQAVSDWQHGGDAKQNLRRGLTLKAICAFLPEQYRTSPLDTFRLVGLEKGSVWDLIGKDRLAEKVTSSTFNASNIVRLAGTYVCR